MIKVGDIAKMVKDALRRQQTNTNNVAILVLVCIVKACLWTIVDVIQTTDFWKRKMFLNELMKVLTI